jgi:hypothetical protein
VCLEDPPPLLVVPGLLCMDKSEGTTDRTQLRSTDEDCADEASETDRATLPAFLPLLEDRRPDMRRLNIPFI